MTLDSLQRAKNLEAVISALKNNIENYKDYEKAKEIKITINDANFLLQPTYLTGEKKVAVINILIEMEENTLNKKLSELEKL